MHNQHQEIQTLYCILYRNDVPISLHRCVYHYCTWLWLVPILTFGIDKITADDIWSLIEAPAQLLGQNIYRLALPQMFICLVDYQMHTSFHVLEDWEPWIGKVILFASTISTSSNVDMFQLIISYAHIISCADCCECDHAHTRTISGIKSALKRHPSRPLADGQSMGQFVCRVETKMLTWNVQCSSGHLQSESNMNVRLIIVSH